MYPRLIDLGNWFLPSYGVLVAIAFLVAIWLTSRLAKRAGLDPEKVTNLAVYCAIAGMIGAKLFMFLFDWRTYLLHPAEIFTRETLQAAGVFQGGLLLAIATAVVYMRRHQLPGLRTADVFAPGIAVGHGIGRIGCFAAGCCWGKECNLPWAVTFTRPEANALTGVPLGISLHPTQIYEALAEAIIFLFLLRYIRTDHKQGSVIGWYMLLYSAVRFCVEFLRNHEQDLVAGLSLTQWISLGTLGAGLWLVFRRESAVTSLSPQVRPKPV